MTVMEMMMMVAFIQRYSPLPSRLTVLACDSTWVTSFLLRIFEYLPKWYIYSAGVAGATWNCSRLDAFCVHHTTMHHVTSCKATYVKCCMFSHNLPPALLAEWLGSFTCYCGNTGWNGDRNESAQKVDPWEEISPTAHAGIRTRDLSITSPAL